MTNNKRFVLIYDEVQQMQLQNHIHLNTTKKGRQNTKSYNRKDYQVRFSPVLMMSLGNLHVSLP